MKSKLYVIITFNVSGMGGGQSYIWGKCEYLDKHGWKTVVYSPGDKNKVPQFEYLNKYKTGQFSFLGINPTHLKTNHIKKAINLMLESYHIEKKEYNEIIVESSENIYSLWGEILAKELNGKHIILNCNEVFAPPKTYCNYLDYYDFKFNRRELYGIHETSIYRLFQERKEIPISDEYVFHAYYPKNVIQDINDSRLLKIKKSDWNIGIFGRCEKPYFKPALNDVVRFAKKYYNKKIQLIIIGDSREEKAYINNISKHVSNLTVLEMGNMSPVPRAIFSKIDVMICSSGCAGWSYLENVYTLVADSINNKANGLLGYDTYSGLVAENEDIQKSFFKYLEYVLVDRKYDSLTRKEGLRESIPDSEEDARYQEHFVLIKKSDQKKEYFDFSDYQIRAYENIMFLIITNKYLYIPARTIRRTLLKLKKLGK
jgi:hypothetical protein